MGSFLDGYLDVKEMFHLGLSGRLSFENGLPPLHFLSIFSPFRGIRLQPPQLCPGLLALTIYWTNSKCSAWNESLTHPNKSTRGSGLKVVRSPHHGIPPSEFHPSMAWNKSHAIWVRNLSAFFCVWAPSEAFCQQKEQPNRPPDPCSSAA